VGEIDHKCGGVKRDEHIWRITRCGDALATELNLKRRDPVSGARRRANFRWEIGHGGQIVASQRGGDGELLTLQLDAVSGIAGEAYGMAEFGAKFLLHLGFFLPY